MFTIAHVDFFQTCFNLRLTRNQILDLRIHKYSILSNLHNIRVIPIDENRFGKPAEKKLYVDVPSNVIDVFVRAARFRPIRVH